MGEILPKRDLKKSSSVALTGNTAVRTSKRCVDSPNAIANFEFDVTLPYRRGEKLFKQRRRRSTTQRDA
jgi:hypothetical protein